MTIPKLSSGKRETLSETQVQWIASRVYAAGKSAPNALPLHSLACGPQGGCVGYFSFSVAGVLASRFAPPRTMIRLPDSEADVESWEQR